MRVPVIASVLVAVQCARASADEYATSPVRAGYEPSEGRAFESESRRALEARGLRWNAAYAVEVFAAPQLREAVVSDGLFAAKLDIDLGTFAGAGLGAAHIEAFGIHGRGLTDELLDVNGISSNVAPQDARFFEAWYEQPIGAFTLRAGLLSADQEYVLAEHSTTLLGAAFGITSQFSANVLGPVYPVATPGVSARLERDAVTVRGALYNGNLDNVHGIPTVLGPDVLVIGEVELAGTVKLGAWHHTTRGSAYYAVVDAALTADSGAFTRAGYSPDEYVDVYIDAGARLSPGWHHDDAICAGLAFARTNDGAQIAVEASYQLPLSWLTLQPDVQLAMLRDRTVGVLGLRATVAF